jgi:hypothetical protein
MRLTKIYKISPSVDGFDYIILGALVVLSITFSNIIISKDFFIPKGIYFNIFEIISINKWLYIILINIIAIAILRTTILLFFRKNEEKASFLSISLHILKYGFIAVPFLFPIIMVGVNKIVMETINNPSVNLNEPLPLGLFYTTIFFLIWMLFLGMTIKNGLFKNYSFLKGVIVNIFSSFIAVLISGFISFNTIISIEKYEIPFIEKMLDIQVELKIISKEDKTIRLEQYIAEH